MKILLLGLIFGGIVGILPYGENPVQGNLEISQDAIIDSIKKINFEYYQGKTIETFFQNRIIQKYNSGRWMAEPHHCFQSYAMFYKGEHSSLSLQLYPQAPLLYMKRCLDIGDSHWKIDSLKKEKVLKVEIHEYRNKQ
jgi:hypothetical protein